MTIAETSPLKNLVSRPIPFRQPREGDKPYREYPIDPQHELSSESLVRIDRFGLSGESYYARADGLNVPYHRVLPGAPRHVWLRRSVVDRLVCVNEAVRPAGLELFLWDGYRTVECQQSIYDWMLEHAMKERGITDLDEARNYISPYISNPSCFVRENPKTWISHITGAAVDLTLRRIDNHEHLYMGGVFDDPAAVSHTEYFEHPENQDGSASAREARRNRRILFNAMIAEGFSSLPSEWWHFDWGDQLWAKHRTRICLDEEAMPAWYGPADLPPDFE